MMRPRPIAPLRLRTLGFIARHVLGVLLLIGLSASSSFAQAPDEVDAPDAAVDDESGGGGEADDTPDAPATDDDGFDSEDFGPESAASAGDVDEDGPEKSAQAAANETETTSADGTPDDATAPSANDDGAASGEVPFGLSPRVFSTLVVAGSAATSLLVSTAVGAGVIIYLLDVHFAQATPLDPMVGVFVLAPAVITAGVGTTLGSAFVLEGRGPMATGLVTSVATLTGAGAALGAAIGIATLSSGDFPVGSDFVGAMTVGTVGAFILGTVAGTAAATGMAFAFTPKRAASNSAATDTVELDTE